eukprot:TRINITY_DN18407_c0_g1_i2.p1 TRINITY_DN18407_c0_g1~~TRINITY_DN18407_c0_g1_i2.p1  ORF type:complete len:386 (-),score=73.48 TRINITY_DN18407_c0_g1_i2:246-1403(-)
MADLNRAQAIQDLLKKMDSADFRAQNAQLDRAEAQKRVPTEDPEALAQFDKEMIADEERRWNQLDQVIRKKFGGIHPLYGSRSVAPAFDAARTLPLHAYPFARPNTQEGSSSREFDYAHSLERSADGRHPNGTPQAEIDALERYSHPLKSLNKEDLDRIDRHRLQAIKAQLEQNGHALPSQTLYPGTKYPLTGPPMKLASDHPFLQPETAPTLLPVAPELRAGELLQDAEWLTQREKEREMHALREAEQVREHREAQMAAAQPAAPEQAEYEGRGQQGGDGNRGYVGYGYHGYHGAPGSYGGYGYQPPKGLAPSKDFNPAAANPTASPPKHRTSESGSILNQTRRYAGYEIEQADATTVGSRHYVSPVRPYGEPVMHPMMSPIAR